MSKKSRKRKAAKDALEGKTKPNGRAKKAPVREKGLELSQFDILKRVAKIMETKEETERADLSIGDWAAKCSPDPAEQEKLIATLLLVRRCHDQGKDIYCVAGLSVFREPSGLNKDMVVKFGERASQALLHAAGILKGEGGAPK